MLTYLAGAGVVQIGRSGQWPGLSNAILGLRWTHFCTFIKGVNQYCLVAKLKIETVSRNQYIYNRSL